MSYSESVLQSICHDRRGPGEEEELVKFNPQAHIGYFNGLRFKLISSRSWSLRKGWLSRRGTSFSPKSGSSIRKTKASSLLRS